MIAKGNHPFGADRPDPRKNWSCGSRKRRRARGGIRTNARP